MNELVKKGDTFICIKDVFMRDFDGNVDTEPMYVKGKIYHSQADDCITNENGNTNHVWDVKELLDKHFKKIEQNIQKKDLLTEICNWLNENLTNYTFDDPVYQQYIKPEQVTQAIRQYINNNYETNNKH